MTAGHRLGPHALLIAAAAAALASAACTTPSPSSDAALDAVTDAVTDAATDADPFADADVHFRPVAIGAERQREGDPDAGYRALVNEGYVSCGIPYAAYAQVAGPAPAELRLPGREGRNAELPYNFTAFRTARGVEVVSANCLACHAGVINNQLVVGLGNHAGDFTTDTSVLATAARGFVEGEAELAEFDTWAERVRAIAPYIRTRTIGVNPADNLAAVLFGHRDRATLAWSRAWLLEPPPTDPVPVDVPPWWRMSRKHSMFYNASGRGDHARIMMTASTLCTDTVAEAERIDAYFDDVRAYIASIRPPPYPFPIDRALAERGRGVYERECSSCHGTYGPGGAYPNLLVSLGEVGTDDTLARGSAQFAGRFVDWFNGSWYGRAARLEPRLGYVAPPLDGIWATAPFLHNGSVPTLAALLDSATRPTYWTRSFASTAYDSTAVGWRFTALDAGQEGEADRARRVRIYDTTLPGYSNRGHTFGDALGEGDRDAVIEYLKTL